MAEIMLGNVADAAALQWHLRLCNEGVTPEMIDHFMIAHVYNIDVRDLLPKVSVPTLVVHYRNNLAVPFEAGRELAAEIPGARFVSLESGAHLFYFSDTRPLLRAIAEFLGRSHRRGWAACHRLYEIVIDSRSGARRLSQGGRVLEHWLLG